MILNYNEFSRYIKADFRNKGKKMNLTNLIKDPVLRFSFLLRLNEFLLNTNKSKVIRFIPLFLFKRLSVRLGFSIPFNVVDEGMAIVHYGLIIISPFAKIGKNCRIHSGVNIGGTAKILQEIDKNKQYAPLIGNNCYLGPGAKLFGAIQIANDCVIGANAVVNKTFMKNGATIAGVPAKIISDKDSSELIIN